MQLVILVIRFFRIRYHHFCSRLSSSTDGNIRFLSTFMAFGTIQLLSETLSVIWLLVSNVFFA